MERLVSGDSIIYVDDTHFPVIITTWQGQADLGNCKAFVAWHERQNARAHRAGVKFVSISDSSHAVRPPPDVRKFFADWMTSNDERDDDASLKTITVITSALIRGALTAIGWVRPEVAEIESVGTMREAISLALETLRAAGIPAPAGLDPDAYASPVDAPRAAAGEGG